MAKKTTDPFVLSDPNIPAVQSGQAIKSETFQAMLSTLLELSQHQHAFLDDYSTACNCNCNCTVPPPPPPAPTPSPPAVQAITVKVDPWKIWYVNGMWMSPNCPNTGPEVEPINGVGGNNTTNPGGGNSIVRFTISNGMPNQLYNWTLSCWKAPWVSHYKQCCPENWVVVITGTIQTDSTGSGLFRSNFTELFGGMITNPCSSYATASVSFFGNPNSGQIGPDPVDTGYPVEARVSLDDGTVSNSFFLNLIDNSQTG